MSLLIWQSKLAEVEASLPASARSTLRKDLRWTINDGAAFGLMVGLGETYLPAFVLAIGLGELAAGMIGSLPLFLGGVLQLISPYAIQLLQSHKRWIVLCSVLQALMFVPLIIAAILGKTTLTSVMLVASIYWASSLATGPAWNTWIGTIIPKPIRPRFFASRTRISQACVFTGFLAAGLFLEWANHHQKTLLAFAILFTLSCVARLVSSFSLAMQSEPKPIPLSTNGHSMKQAFLETCRGPGGQLLIFLGMFQAAVQLSGPYFTPFMFNRLQLSYDEFMMLIAVAFLARIISLPAWGHWAHRHGARQLLWIGALGIAPVSMGWVVSQQFYWLMLIQVYSGMVWAAYELAFFLMFFESIPEEKRTSMLTVYNLINVTAWVSGAALGGFILFRMNTQFEGYLLLFGLSAIGRFFAILLLYRVPKIDVAADEIGLRTIAVRPNGANLDAPVLPSLPDQFEEEPELVTASGTSETD